MRRRSYFTGPWRGIYYMRTEDRTSGVAGGPGGFLGGRRNVGADGSVRPEYFSFFASGGLLLSVATKVTKSAIQGGRKFRSSFPLENPPSLSDQRGRAAALPLWKHPPGVGDYQIAPLPRSGKGRWRPLAAVDMKRDRIPTGASRPRNDREKTGRMLGRRM